MIISVNWLKQFVAIDLSVDELATRIGERLVEIESVEDLGQKYKDVIIAKVVECAPLEGSDHLNITKIDDGGVREGIERDDNGLVQVVCGAPNVKSGMLVAWLPPKSTVPESAATAEPFVLDSRPLRGAMSHGMLASAKELDLFEDHSGILEVDKDAAPGTPFAEVYELNDYLLDIENKSLTHRPDAFGVIGFAREVAGILGLPFQTPDWLTTLDGVVDDEPLEGVEAPAVVIEDATLSDRFQAVVLADVNEAATSPLLMQTYLARSGVRPINASVDVSNYLMLLTGQPTHAYDYHKVRAIAGNDFTIRVRSAREGEQLTLLDGKAITLDPSDVVIAAGETAVALAGIMGGSATAVDATTKVVLFEAATFNLYKMRGSQMRHGVFSDAVTRFTKGIPAALSTPVLFKAVALLNEYTGGRPVSPIVQDYPGPKVIETIRITEETINGTLGTQFTLSDIVELLENVGFVISVDGLTLAIEVPYWRHDVHLPEDIIEEVGRLAGFDTIAPTLPRRTFTAVKPGGFDQLRAAIRAALVRAGANEVLTYSFVHGDVMRKAGQDPANSYRIVNSISPELQYYRQSLTPSLLAQVTPNVKAGYGTFALFELNKVHLKSDGLTDENVPVEQNHTGLVVTSTEQSKGAAYFEAKHLLEYLLSRLNITAEYQVPTDTSGALFAPFDVKRSASIVNTANGEVVGVVGEYNRAVQKAFKLQPFTAGFELDTKQLLSEDGAVQNRYRPLGKYPSTERDVCFQVATSVSYETVLSAASTALEAAQLITRVEPLDIYLPENSDVKNVTLRFVLASYEKTMTNEEITSIMDSVTAAVLQATDGRVV